MCKIKTVREKKLVSSFCRHVTFAVSALNFIWCRKKLSVLWSDRFMILRFIETFLSKLNLRCIRFKRHYPPYRRFRFIPCPLQEDSSVFLKLLSLRR